VPFISPPISELDISRASDSIRSGWLVPGDYSSVLEKDLSNFFRADNCFLTSSCTHAIQIALHLAGVGQGDEVITSTLTWVAAPNSVLWAGAAPIFVDVDPQTFLMTPEICQRAITSRTKAIIITHLYGQMCDVVGFKELADKYGILIIEDCAHALEADYQGIRPGQITFAAAFSFHAAKNITSGQGGALIVEADRKTVLMARRHGVVNDAEGIRRMQSFGGKFEMTDFQAALLIGQLERIEEIKLARTNVWNFYEQLCLMYGVKHPINLELGYHARYQFVIKLDTSQKRNSARRVLRELGIETSVHFTPVHLEPFYLNRELELSLPISENIGETIISLPTHVKVGANEKNQLANAFAILRREGLI
jgi:perosamine synthetase